VDELQEHLKTNPLTDKTILIKGSRGIRLEKLLEIL
jgi:UDP-N-acetylmuramyl pentapeptide synthase